MSRAAFLRRQCSHSLRLHVLRGLTLVEAMVTVAVLSILFGIAAPSFTSLIERWRTAQAISAIESSWHYARVESLRRGGGITLSAATCAGDVQPNWRCGLEVGATVLENGESSTQILRATALTSSNLQISSNSPKVTFDRHGNIVGASVKFTLKNHDNAIVKEICINKSFYSESGDSSCQ